MTAIKLSQEQFIRDAKKIHNEKYDYSKVVYVNSRAKVTIVCSLHGDFDQKSSAHRFGQGCPKCVPQKQPLTLNQFIEKSNKIHDNKYLYSMVEYSNNDKKVSIICQSHGIFNQLPGSHLAGHGCPKCKKSIGEDRVRDCLNNYGLKFIEQVSFDGCTNKLPLRFDFYLPDNNCVIEYDGVDHFKPVTRSKNDTLSEYRFELMKKNDEIKNKFCLDKNIKLYRITYKEFSDIDSIIKRISVL